MKALFQLSLFCMMTVLAPLSSHAEKQSMDELIEACKEEARAEGVTEAKEAEAFIKDCVDQKIQEDLSAPPGSYYQ